MKLGFFFSFRFIKPGDSGALIHRAAFLLLLVYSFWLLWLLYHTLYRNIIDIPELDPSQVTAKQEQVNRKLLETVTAKDETKTKPADFEGLNDPFSR